MLLSGSQELSAGAAAVLKPGLGAFSRYGSVKPSHPLVRRGGDPLLQLRPLADDGLLQTSSLQASGTQVWVFPTEARRRRPFQHFGWCFHDNSQPS